jgi:deazaflavin-dependent oxidoreductase (nitroreductase family)
MTPNSECAECGLDGEYVPSPLRYVRKQVADYEATAGVHGGTLEGRPVVILTSVGAKSGLVRKNPVMRIVDGDRYVAVASDGGASTNPSWYTNLVAHPRVRLQDGAVVRELRVREVSGDEKRYYWTVAQRFWPHFPEYRRLAGGRDIPIMVLEPTAADIVRLQDGLIAEHWDVVQDEAAAEESKSGLPMFGDSFPTPGRP